MEETIPPTSLITGGICKPYRIQYFENNAVGCHECIQVRYEKIRIAKIPPGVYVNCDNGNTELALEWYHETCFFDYFQPSSVDEIDNFENMRVKDQIRIQNTIQKRIPLKEIATNEHLRHILLFMYHKGIAAADAVKAICTVYGPDTFTLSAAQKLYCRFRSGEFIFKNQPHHIRKDGGEETASSSNEESSDTDNDKPLRRKQTAVQNQSQGLKRFVCDSSFSIEYSKFGRTNCNICNQKINKREMRISKTDKRGKPKIMWHHVKCFSRVRDKYDFLKGGNELAGFENLSIEHQQQIKDTIPTIKIEIKDPTESTNSIMPEIKIEVGDTEYIAPNVGFVCPAKVEIKTEKDLDSPPEKRTRLSPVA